MSNLIPSQFGEPGPSGTPLNLSLLQQQQQQHQLLLQAAPTLQQSMAGTGAPSQQPQPQQLILNPVTQAKRRRSLPGNPDPDAEVIALSPKSLLATNRFVCEVCGKGFQRDQNLQLHRRGHNLPWKLKQKAQPGDETPRKKVYVCPESTCVHHDPARALGDLTGIKKHFCRKHWEKKWKCERCSKKYAVQSDWKAHVKTCGTKEYRCGCGTLFSRRDSFITHRAFCDALSEETARSMSVNPVAGAGGSLVLHHHHPNHPFLQLHQPSPSSASHHQHHGHHDSIMANLTSLQTAAVASSLQQTGHFPPSAAGHAALFQELALKRNQQQQLTGMGQQAETDENPLSANWPPFCQPSAAAPVHHQTVAAHQQQLVSLDLPSSLFLPNRSLDHHLSPSHFQSPAPAPHMSATALLQRAAQMGATMSHQLEPSAPNTAHLSPVAASITSATAPSSSGFSLGLSSPHDTGGSSLTSFGHDFSSQPNQVVHDMVVMASMAAHPSGAGAGVASDFNGGTQFDVDGIGRMLGIKREDHRMGGLQGSSASGREHVQIGGGGGGVSDGMTRDFLGLRGFYHRDIHGIVSTDPTSGGPTSFEQAQQQMKKHWN